MILPAYLNNISRLRASAEKASALLERCAICPRKCGVNRLKGQTGYCHTAAKARVYNYMAHRGEEPAISGRSGSGTIFFSGCNLKCSYCQNFEFSQSPKGTEVSDETLAGYMLTLQEKGCHNINLVTPTHVMPQILSALLIASKNGLNIPIVYNTSGYELPEMLSLLEFAVDVYLPDMRYGNNSDAMEYSDAKDYTDFNFAAVEEMHKQTKEYRFTEEKIILRGTIIRHLVLPGMLDGSEKIFKFISEKLSKEVYISLMSQYTPFHKASGIPPINRRLSKEEYCAAQQLLDKYGLHNGWIQEDGGLDHLAGIHIKQNT